MDADLPFVQGRPERFGIKPDAGAHQRQNRRTESIHRGSEHGMWNKAVCVIEGNPELVEVTPTRPKGWRPAWVSERAIVARKPGNAGGAKGPYFGCVSEEGKEEVIDVESDNTQ